MSSGSTQPPRRRPPSVLPRPRNVAGRTQGRLRVTSPTPAPRSWWRRATRRIRRFTGTVFTAGVWSRIGRLTTWIGAVGVAVAAFTGLVFSYQQYRLTEQGQITDRFTKAVEQLGSDETDVRLGGIYSLERLARDSKTDQPTIIEVLGAYVRDHAPAPAVDPEAPAATPHCARERFSAVPIDIQAVVRVIGRRDPEADGPTIVDLSQSCLVGVLVYPAQLPVAFLATSDLRGAILPDADLRGAILYSATLADAKLSSADLSDANLLDADLTGADLSDAKLAGADLSRATLTGADLAGISYNSSTKWPNGFTPPPSS